MGFLSDLKKKAVNIASSGKNTLLEQLSSKTVYERDESGQVQKVSDTGNKPQIARTAKEFIIPSRGYTDQQINEAKPTTRDKTVGIAKAAGEIVQGGLTLANMLGNQIADTVLPGYDAEATAANRNKLNEKISEKLAPKTAGEAKTMRVTDVVGLITPASITRVGNLSKLDEISDAAKNSLKNDSSSAREKTLNYLREDPKRVQEGEVRLREIEDGSIVIEDGRHRLEVGRETGTKPNIVDVTSEYTGKPSQKVAQLKMELEAETAPKTKPQNITANERAVVSPKQFDIPKTPAGKVDVPTYVKQQTAAREAARGNKSIGTKAKEFMQNLENKMIDFTAPIQRRVDKSKKSDPLAFGDKADIKDNIDRVFNAPSITAAFVKEKGFSKVVQEVGEQNLDAFDQYLTAKHATDLESKGIKTGRNMEADAALVKELGPQFEKAATEIQKYNSARLDYMVESGLISKELKEELLTKHPNYVPFQRVFSEDELVNGGKFGGSGVASLSKQSVVQKIVGSDREIESPLESLLELTSKAVQQGEKNKAALTLTSYADLPGNPFGLRKIEKTTDAAADKDTISVLRDGKKEIWEVDTDVAVAAKALDVERMNILGKILAFPLRVARLGITGVNVPFVAANVVRDQISAFIMSDKGLRSSIANPKVFLPALGNAIGHGKLYDEMLSEGALMTSFDVVRDSVKPTLKSIVADKSRLSKASYVVKSPSQWFRAVEDMIGRSEEVTRMQQYLGNKQAALAEGATEAQARVIAARAARENSTNFARRGEWGTVMNNTILYLNAGIQGSRLLVRNLKNKPVKTSAKIATTLMLPAATIAYWNLSDPKRKEAYEDIQEYEKENNFIIIPPNPVKDENGRWEVFKLPLPPGVGQFTNFVRRPIEASQGLDEVGFGEAAANLLRTVSPTDLSNPASSLTPQIIKPSIQAATNKNLFTGYDIVPKSMQDLPAEQQVKDTTSGTATDIANTLGVSPIKTEQFINDTLGGIGPQILNAADRATGQEVVGGRSIPESVLRRFTSAAGNKLEADQLDEIYSLRTEARGETNQVKMTAQATLAELRKLPKDQANTELKRIFEENKPLYDAINKARKQEDRGLTKVESAIEDLPVKDGTRAAYIYSEYLQIREGSPEDAKAYLKELRAKKIISDEVLEQLNELRQAE